MSDPRLKETPPRQNRPKSAKTARTIIPAPQCEQIMQLHFLGKSIRQIAREQKRDRGTVAKIVHSDEMREFVVNLREQLYGLGGHALKAVKHTLVVAKDGHLAYRLLTDIGAVPSPLERELIRANGEMVKDEELNAFEKEIVGGSEGQSRQVGLGFARVIQERAKIYGFKLPTPQEMRHNKVVCDVLAELTEGQASKMVFSNPAEWHRLKASVEDAFRRLKETEEKHKQDQLKERAAMSRPRSQGSPGSTHRPRLRLAPVDDGDGGAVPPGSGSPSDKGPSSQGGS
jgi:hypothetical protein